MSNRKLKLGVPPEPAPGAVDSQSYDQFLAGKIQLAEPTGYDVDPGDLLGANAPAGDQLERVEGVA